MKISGTATSGAAAIETIFMKAPCVLSATELAVENVRSRVLGVIRRAMPIETLFDPRLKLDLSLFVKDQMFMARVAGFLVPLAEKASAGPVDPDEVASHFAGSEFLAEVASLSIKNLTGEACLAFFYEACVDVLNKAKATTLMKEALSGRIYTFKNALIAQSNPGMIRTSQERQKSIVQDMELIRQEGRCFLREVLSMYLKAHLELGEGASFFEELRASATALIPFVRLVTQSYLRECSIPCGEDPLRYRDMGGYNRHGMVASTVMEACLKGLGYSTQLLGRSDLEPRATLATTHSIVLVQGDDDLKYIVDPAYAQFHMDFCLEDSQVPLDPVLVLESSSTVDYIESTIMTHWDHTFKELQKGDPEVIRITQLKGQSLAYMLNRILPEELAPSSMRVWAKNAMTRVWGLLGYQPILYDSGFYNVFQGADSRHLKTYNLIKGMEISQLAAKPSLEEIEDQLKRLRTGVEGKKNTPEAISLISLLPKPSRLKYMEMLDCDPRLQRGVGMEVTLSAYFRSLRQSVNPEGREYKAVYGCSGSDITTLLLATDASDIMFVDLTEIKREQVEKALSIFRGEDILGAVTLNKTLGDGYLTSHSRYGGASSQYLTGGEHRMENLPLKLMFELNELGVDMRSVRLSEEAAGDVINIEFAWNYTEAERPKKRCLRLIKADITNPASYPAALRAFLETKIDVFYMKASFFAPLKYGDFLPHICSFLNMSGWLMTTDKTLMMEQVDPTPCFEASGSEFFVVQSEQTRLLQELMQPPFDPLANIPVLDMFPPEKRYSRTPGCDLSYWSQLTVRQKLA